MSYEDFSYEMADDFSTKYDTNSSVVKDLLGGTVAAVTDFGASTWNSLVPEKYETSTEDLLTRIDSNALRVYEENPDAVHLASFVGGVFVPTGLALKGMTMARDGMKGINWFSTAGRNAQKTKIAEAFEQSVGATDSYKKAVNGLYGMTAANAVADAVAMEAALVLTMNAHPFMEDYVENPAKNFAIGLALGSGIGGAIGHIADRAAVKGISMAVEREAISTIFDKDIYKTIDSTENLSAQIAARQNNVNNWEKVLRESKAVDADTPAVRELNPFTQNMLEVFIAREKASLVTAFEEMASAEIKSLSAEKQAAIMKMLADNPERFAGVDKLRFASIDEDVALGGTKIKGLVSSTSEKPSVKGAVDLNEPLITQTKKGKDKGVTLIYSPVHDAFMLSSDFKYYSTAADLGVSGKSLTKGLENNFHLAPRYDVVWEKAQQATAAADVDYLRTLRYYDELSIKEFEKAVVAVAPDDIAALSAIHARMQKEIALNPEAFNTLAVQITKEMPNYDLAGTKIIEKVITQTKILTKTINGTNAPTPPSTNVMEQFTRHLRSNGKTYGLMDSRNALSPEARQLAWSFSGTTDTGDKTLVGMHLLRRGMDSYLRKDKDPQKLLTEAEAAIYGNANYKALRAQGKSHEQAMKLVGDEQSMLGKYAEEIYNSKYSKQLRADLKKYADEEGYIYLYRGMKGAAKGHRPGESYTPDYRVAFEFAGRKASGVGLYRVHLDEVIGNLERYGGHGGGGEAEIVLDVPTRVVAGKLQVQQGTTSSGHTVTEVLTGEDIKQSVKEVSGSQKTTANATQIFQQLLNAKKQAIDELLARGVPPESIALYTNTPVNTVKNYMAKAGGDLLESSIIPGGGLQTYSSAAWIDTYLDTSRRSLAVSTNMERVPLARIKQLHQSKGIADTEYLLKSTYLMNAPSSASVEMAKYLGDPNTTQMLQVLRAELNKVTGSGVGSKILSSSDFALRDLGAIGKVAATIGDDLQRLMNKVTTKFKEPLEASFKTLSTDHAGLVELSTALNLNNGLKGFRQFVVDSKTGTGKFMRQDEVEPFKEIFNPTTGKTTKVKNMVPALMEDGTELVVKTPEVVAALTRMQEMGRELYALRNTTNKLFARRDLSDMGFWAPPPKFLNKEVAYVVDQVLGTTTMLHAADAVELNTLKQAFLSTLDNSNGRFQIIDKGVQDLFNKYQFRHDPLSMSNADISMFHKGSSASKVVNTSRNLLAEISNSYDDYIQYNMRQQFASINSDVLERASYLSTLANATYKNQPLDTIKRALFKPHDGGKIFSNTLMGYSNLDQYPWWKEVNSATHMVAELGLRSLKTVFEPILNQSSALFGKGKSLSDTEWTKLVADLEKRGIPNPFKNMDEAMAKQLYHQQQISNVEHMTPRLLALSNGLAATMMLRFMDAGHALVTAISFPILASGAIGRQLDKSFMGAGLNPEARFKVISTMYNGVRYGGSIEGMAMVKKAEEMGLFKPIVSEATEALAQSRRLERGVVSKVEQALESNLVNMLSIPSDYMEALSRKMAFQTGAYLAKESYPGLGEAGRMVFARDFMNQVVGNYNAAQRPSLFQGTMGVALGLFQTYMLTMAQQMYRGIEQKNWKSLAKMMLAQSTIFGAHSLPGYNHISTMIGEHFSDQNIDLTTGLYRGLPDTLANIVVYGLPSQLGPAVTTRGEIQPRIPNVLNDGINAVPAINIMGQALNAGNRFAEAAFTLDRSMGKAMLEALSVQSISRPIARVSELASGESITGKGNVVMSQDELYTVPAMLARAFSMRDLEEVKRREAIHLNSVYGSLDYEARNKVTKKLKTYLRDGNLTPEVLENLAEDYLRTGSPQGWRSAVNKAIAQQSVPGGSAVRNYLAPDSPLQMMIEDLE